MEYLNELQQRNKWQTKSQNLLLDTIVIIKDNLSPIMTWRLGKVIETYPWPDRFVRTAVKTSTGVIKRTIYSLALLPLEPKTKTLQFGMLMLLALFVPLVMFSHVTCTQIDSNPAIHFQYVRPICKVFCKTKHHFSTLPLIL